MNPDDFKPGLTMRQLFGDGSDPTESVHTSMAALTSRIEQLEGELRARDIPVPPPPPEPPSDHPHQPANVQDEAVPAAEPRTSAPATVPTVAEFDIPDDVASNIAAYPIVPDDNVTEEAFIVHLQAVAPALPFTEWIRMAPYLMAAIPSFSLETIKGWPSYDAISQALQSIKRVAAAPEGNDTPGNGSV